MGGTIMEDIRHYNRLAVIFTVYRTLGKLYQTAQPCFGTQAPIGVKPQLLHSAQHRPDKTAATRSKRAIMTLDHSALFAQDKWLPLYALSGCVEINLSMARPQDVVRVLNEAGTQPAQSVPYTLCEIAMHMSLCTLDDQLQEAYNTQMLNVCRSPHTHARLEPHTTIPLAWACANRRLRRAHVEASRVLATSSSQ